MQDRNKYRGYTEEGKRVTFVAAVFPAVLIRKQEGKKHLSPAPGPSGLRLNSALIALP